MTVILHRTKTRNSTLRWN